jgi:hypothetical protein
MDWQDVQKMSNPNAPVEAAFRLVARSIDEVGKDKAELFLAKLALILAQVVNDETRFEDAVRRALRSDAAALETAEAAMRAGH